MTGFSEPRYFNAAKLELSAKVGVLKRLQGSLTLFLHWFLSNMWAQSNWWFSFWISLASVMKSLPSFSDCQCLIHLHQVPAGRFGCYYFLFYSFIIYRKLGHQKIEWDLTIFSIELINGKRYTFICGPGRNSWIVAILGRRKEKWDSNPIFLKFCCCCCYYKFLKKLSSQSL